ncbi:MAG: T9SS type A sorting domain-containing protein [Bacteroidales bacterium]|nr:T9SS type A sorting domain-containing protein [Bacteroidales bacterium]
MKKSYKFLYLLLIPFAALLLSNMSGSIGGKTGSPGDNGANCTECHVGTPITQNGWIETNIPPNGFTPGETYEITVNASHPDAGRFGFELTAESEGGVKLGGFTLTDPTRTRFTNGSNAITHTSSGNAGGNSTSWSVGWTAPEGQSVVRFYAAVNGANGNGANTGDQIYLTNLFVNQALPAVLVSVEPGEAEKGSSPELTLIGANTTWGSETPVVSIINVEDDTEVYTAASVTVFTDEELVAVIHIPFEATVGSYTVQAGDVSLPGAFEVTVVNGLEAQTADEFKMFPNPLNSDVLSVEFNQEGDLLFYSIEGKLIDHFKVNSGLNRLSLNELQSGMYIVVGQMNEKSFTQKLVVH